MLYHVIPCYTMLYHVIPPFLLLKSPYGITTVSPFALCQMTSWQWQLHPISGQGCPGSIHDLWVSDLFGVQTTLYGNGMTFTYDFLLNLLGYLKYVLGFYGHILVGNPRTSHGGQRKSSNWRILIIATFDQRVDDLLTIVGKSWVYLVYIFMFYHSWEYGI